MQRTCWILGVDEKQREDMLPGTVSMGFPLVGDLGRFGSLAVEDDPENDDSENDDPEGDGQRPNGSRGAPLSRNSA